MLFDTLKLSKDLQESFTPQQAETLDRVLGGAGDDQLATKGDVQHESALLRTELRQGDASLREEIARVQTTLRTEIENLGIALRGEMAALRSELKGDIAELRAETKTEIAAVRVDISAFRDDISLLRTETVKWIVTAIGFNFLATAGLIVALVKVFGH